MPGANSIDGLISGFNTTEIVNSIIEYERIDAVMMENDQALKTNIVSAFKALQAKVLALNASIRKLTYRSTFNANEISVSDETILSATSYGKAATGSYEIQVQEIARNHQIASQGISDDSIALMGTGDISIKVGDGTEHTVTIDANSNSLVGIKQAINDAHIGVTATIINDGSSNNSFRLMITADKTGQVNKIDISSNLSGGTNLNFNTSMFDSPEIISFDIDSDAQVSLDSMSSYTGSTNKIYTFTVEGDTPQTVGSDTINLNWTDGINSGTITVTQADTEVELVGDGADGLKLNFSTGTLNAGDTFQVQAFSPIVQNASDAKISFGASSGLGSPIVVTSETNTFNEVITGIKFDVHKITAPGESVIISSSIGTEEIKSSIDDFIKRYNEVIDFIDTQNEYNQDTEESGILFGDSTLWLLRQTLSYSMGAKIDGLNPDFNQLYSIGIRSKMDGKLGITDSSRLENALQNNLEDVIKLFADGGTSSHSGIDYVSATEDTTIGDGYEVDITSAATHGTMTADTIIDPSTNPLVITDSNNSFKLKINGVESDLMKLTSRTYTNTASLVSEIQNKIDSDSKIGTRGLTVEWVDEGANGYLKFSSSTYGESSKVERVTSISNSIYGEIGLLSPDSVNGTDVAGTINGEEAEGTGQLLKGLKDNETTTGLVLRITLDETQVSTGVEGTVDITKGIAARLRDKINSYVLEGDGLLDRKVMSYENQISDITEQVHKIDERLELRRESLYKQYYAMEASLSEFQVTSQFLDSQLAGLNANWSYMKNSGK